MLNVDMLPAVLTETLQQHVGFLRGSQRLDQFHFAAGEIIFLDIDDQKSSVHN